MKDIEVIENIAPISDRLWFVNQRKATSYLSNMKWIKNTKLFS